MNADAQMGGRGRRTLRTALATLSTTSMMLLVASMVLRVIERVLLANAGFEAGHQVGAALVSGAIAFVLWISRALLGVWLLNDVRLALTVLVAERLLAKSIALSASQRSQAETVVYEMRFVTERVAVSSLPALVSDAVACVIVLPLYAHMDRTFWIAVLGTGAGLGVLALGRTHALAVASRAWAGGEILAQSMLAGVHAGPELIVSGRDAAYIDRVRAEARIWIAATRRAAALSFTLERLPLAGVVLLGFLAASHGLRASLEDSLRMASLFPAFAGFSKGIVEITRSWPQLRAMDGWTSPGARAADSSYTAKAPVLPCSIRFRDVTFHYPPRPTGNAVGSELTRGLTFEWRPGTMLAIRGANGTGKSSVLKLMSGLLRPVSGCIEIGETGLDELGHGDWRRSVAYMPQQPCLPRGMSVRQGMRLLEGQTTDADAQRALEQLGVWERLRDKQPLDPLVTSLDALSAGERQRVALARVIVTRPTLILLDEPDEGLDAAGSCLLTEMLVRMRHRTMIAVATHDRELLATADVVIDLGG